MASVRDFGAAGDAKTDDTEALQHALEAGDGVLALEKGTYRITRPLVLDLAKGGYAAVRGEGGASRIVMAGPGPAVRIVGDHRGTADPASVKPHIWLKERFPTIAGVEILGQHAEAVGIELFRTMQATLTGVLVRRCKYAVHLKERNRNFVLADCHLYDNSHYGVFFDRCNLHQAILCGNHISYNQHAGIKSVDGDVHNIQITGNDIEYNRPRGAALKKPHPAADVWFDARNGCISEVTLASNTIQATITPGGANLRIVGAEKDSPRMARLIAISGNVLGSQQRGIELRHAQRVAITGNTIYDSDDLSLDARHCSGLSMASNTIVWRGVDHDPPRDGLLLEDCENAALIGLVTQRMCYGTAEHGAGITLRRCRDSAVSDCQVLDPAVRGIELEDCLRTRVSNNTVVDRRKQATMRQAIRILGKRGDNLVHGNLLGGAVEQALDVPKGTADVQGNVHAKV